MSSSPIDVTMPQMGVSVAEGTVVEWRARVGDSVRAEETVCEISTDKIDSEVPAPAEGVLAEILVEVGQTVAVGTVLARISADGQAHVQATAQHAGADAPHLSPVVARIAVEHRLDLTGVRGSGRGGRIRKQDVLALVKRGNGTTSDQEENPPPPLHTDSAYRPNPPATGGLSRMRRQIGEHMKRSLQTAATCTTWIEVDLNRVERLRAASGLTALAYVARATILALREHPALNATLEGERYTRGDAVNLGIAVSLGDEGLIVPVIHAAEELSPEGLGSRIRELAGRARTGALSPDDVRGATFTITNPGQYGSIMATPVINQPQVAILDLEAVVKRAVVVTDADGSDSIAIRPMTILGLSWDHRALDGVQAAQFLGAIRHGLEAGGEA